MAFFENLSEVITSKGKEAADVAKKMAEIANLKSQLTAVNVEIKKNYTKIGEAYFNAYKDSQVDCEFETEVQTIRNAMNAVKDLEKKINGLKGTVECKLCGHQMDIKSNFCSKCGGKLEVDYFDEEDEEEFSEIVDVEEFPEVVEEEILEEVEEILEDME